MIWDQIYVISELTQFDCNTYQVLHTLVCSHTHDCYVPEITHFVLTFRLINGIAFEITPDMDSDRYRTCGHH